MTSNFCLLFCHESKPFTRFTHEHKGKSVFSFYLAIGCSTTTVPPITCVKGGVMVETRNIAEGLNLISDDW